MLVKLQILTLVRKAVVCCSVRNHGLTVVTGNTELMIYVYHILVTEMVYIRSSYCAYSILWYLYMGLEKRNKIEGCYVAWKNPLGNIILMIVKSNFGIMILESGI